jgi:hypothetical protein
MTVPTVEDCSNIACSPIQTEKYVVSWISCGSTPHSPHSTAEREGDSDTNIDAATGSGATRQTLLKLDSVRQEETAY